MNSQWRTCWCLLKNGQLWFYQEKGKNKVSQPAVNLEGCSVLPDPSPEHLYSFRIDMDGTQMATLEVDNKCFLYWMPVLKGFLLLIKCDFYFQSITSYKMSVLNRPSYPFCVLFMLHAEQLSERHSVFKLFREISRSLTGNSVWGKSTPHTVSAVLKMRKDVGLLVGILNTNMFSLCWHQPLIYVCTQGWSAWLCAYECVKGVDALGFWWT